jgi:pyruvate/2-oxoglutarate dehydrogenase complex dihydrolipoamide dehydrogenase (E3) component
MRVIFLNKGLADQTFFKWSNRILLGVKALVHNDLVALNSRKGVLWTTLPVPRCIYTSPEAASVGLIEAEAKKEYGEIRVGRFPLSGLGKVRIVGGFGFSKVISEKKFDRILGYTWWVPT